MHIDLPWIARRPSASAYVPLRLTGTRRMHDLGLLERFLPLPLRRPRG